MRKVKFFDTTMRDGEQGIGFLLTNEDKIKLIECLEKQDVEVIEIGMVTDETSNIVFDRISELGIKKPICTLCRLNDNDIVNNISVMKKIENPIINLLCVGSEIHLTKKMNLSLEDYLKKLEYSIGLIDKSDFHGNIYAILEDASRGSFEYLEQNVSLLIEKEVKDICFADTVGCMTPRSVRKLMKHFVSRYPQVNFSVHFHNDLGLAVANSIEAIYNGASMIQTTIGGVGERCGNTSLEEIVAILEYCQEYQSNFITGINLRQAIGLSNFYYDMIGKKPYPNKPIIGEYAFRTCAGIHQAAILKNPETYEFINPNEIGLTRSFHVNRLSSNKVKASHSLVN
ncbi:LeuA family protein [Photobacterium sp. 1_MG-2023]|uniref:LeuA family protein n=1 Tax=Photobacterium sp. 1_MG-2023 TaxID=3062646 RepID=UPI0026E188C9|nr:LeuA family protein [Photobacterium sp. 1_MG-2023]MDO6709017.1 LeuA family protein [Photobacterium sp. 1_MG-2023]